MDNRQTSKIIQVWETRNKISNPTNNIPQLDIIHQIASLFAAGSFYYYILDFVDYKMTFVHDGIKNVLGINPEDWSLDKLFEIMHPDDIDKMQQKEALAIKFLLEDNPPENIPLYKVSYLMRLRHSNGNYKTILQQVKTLCVSNNGKVQQVLGVHTDVTYLNIPFDHKISFISDKKPTYHFNEFGNTFKVVKGISEHFTKREKEIIKLLSIGKKAKEIADYLYISSLTVYTHKRNILKKSNCENTLHLITKCIREGFI